MPPEESGFDRPPLAAATAAESLETCVSTSRGPGGVRALGGLSSLRLLDKLSEEARSRCRSPSVSDRDILDELS